MSQTALTIAVFPLVTLVIPTMLVVVGLTSMSGVGGIFEILTNFINHSDFSLAIGIVILCLNISTYSLIFSRKDSDTQWKRRSRSLPTSWGGVIDLKIRDIWSDLKQTETAPEVYWFPALDIAAYAIEKNGPEIYISAALAESLLRGDKMASAIIAHEMSHFIHRDQRHFRHLNAMVITSKFSQWIIVLVGTLATTGHMIKNYYEQSNNHIDLIPILVEQTAMLFVGFNWYFISAILGWFAVTRHAALVTALIEIRADMVAAKWTGGLEQFTQAFVSARSSQKSKKSFKLTALLSPYLTHLPKEERLSLMESSQAILVPKLKYYLASIALASLLPLNFFIPLFFGGSISHVASFVLALFIQLIVVFMLITPPNLALFSISVKRLLSVSIIAIVSIGLTRMNMEPIAYFIVSWFAGFGGESMNWTSLLPDLLETVKDLSQKAFVAFLNPGSLIAVCFTLAMLIRYCRNVTAILIQPSGRLHYIIVLFVLIVFTILASYDPYRVDYWPIWMSSLSEHIYKKLGDWASLLQSLPICAALLTHEIILRIKSFRLRVINFITR